MIQIRSPQDFVGGLFLILIAILALVFSDIVGSTPYFERFGDAAGHQLQQLHFDVLGRCLPARGGRVIAAKATPVSTGPSRYAVGDRVFHQKFGYGAIAEIEGNKLEIEFEQAGRKRVMDSFVSVG